MRQVVNINELWAFCKTKEIPTTLPDDWETVNLPHTWNALDGQDGGADYFRGHGIYAKNLVKTSLPVGRIYFLELNGANSSTDIYWNGKSIAHHDGGYSTWRVALPELCEENLLVVDVDNAPNETVYPQNADFTFYGGLYRNVNLICVGTAHFDLETDGTPGFKVTPSVEDKCVKIEAFTKNAAPDQSLRFWVRDAGSAVVGKTSVLAECGQATIPFEEIHLWHGREDPYLYTVEAQLLENGDILDCISTRVGFRSFRVDPDRGFLLNGREYPLHGVSRHQDRLGIGNALLPEHHAEDVDLICELGATTVRLAHYQHDQYFYDLCDERGLVVWAEIPYISRHLPSGRENTLRQMAELITQNYHHASIVCWGLSNEITMAGAATKQVQENHLALNDLCHSMDKTRLTTMACMTYAPMNDPYVAIPDVVSYNHYFGWYGGDTDMNGAWMDSFTQPIPRGPSECLNMAARV